MKYGNQGERLSRSEEQIKEDHVGKKKDYFWLQIILRNNLSNMI